MCIMEQKSGEFSLHTQTAIRNYYTRSGRERRKSYFDFFSLFSLSLTDECEWCGCCV
jgi:hypothetical protein